METSIIFITAAFFSFFISYLLASFEIYPFFRFFYVFAWYSYIFFVDGINYLIKGDSLIISRTKEFVYMLFVSCGMWLVFELFNLSLKNWGYNFVPFDSTDRYLFYLLLFSSVLPAIFETEELIESLGIFRKFKLNISIKLNEKHINRWIYTGIFLSTLSLIFPKIFFPLMWLSLMIIFEPLNYKLGTRSLVKESSRGNIEKILSKTDGCKFFPDHNGYQTPVDVEKKYYVTASRLKKTPFKNEFSLWLCGDNLYKGAALNSVQIAEIIIKKYFK